MGWLAFNHRVLQEAASPEVPLIERVRFLGIFSNNLDEFFRVRVANLVRASLVGPDTRTTLGFDVRETLGRVKHRVVELQEENNRIFAELEEALHAEGIHFVDETEFNADQTRFATDYFQRVIRPVLVPVMIGGAVPFPELRDGTLYLAVGLVPGGKAVASSDGEDRRTLYAVIEVPSHLPRFIELPSPGGQHHVAFIEDLIRQELPRIFALFAPERIAAHAIKVTRDAEIDVDDDLTRSLMEKMASGLAKRKRGDYVRFLYDARMPKEMLGFIKRKLKLVDTGNIIAGSRYHNRKDLMGFPDFGRKELVFADRPPLPHPQLQGATNLFDEVRKGDVLLHFPYQEYGYIVDLLRESAMDPRVTSIRINLYRVARHSQITNALINAARNGKSVQVVVEIAARFDERNNMQVAQDLQEAGVQVLFGVPGLKVHAKLFHIARRRGKGTEAIAHVGTGNFHERNARIYADFSLLTADPVTNGEVERLFHFFEHNYERTVFRTLIVSPYSTRRRFEALIDREIEAASEGREAWLVLKVNNIIDAELIAKLYEASTAGVRIRLLVRGICSLIPGVPGMSEHIAVTSIVGRYLEHARVLVFANGGDPEYFLSSADWMTRNLDRRVEVSIPVRDAALKAELRAFIDLQLHDTAKARTVEASGANRYVEPAEGAAGLASQDEVYRRLAAYGSLAAAAVAEPLTSIPAFASQS